MNTLLAAKELCFTCRVTHPLVSLWLSRMALKIKQQPCTLSSGTGAHPQAGHSWALLMGLRLGLTSPENSQLPPGPAFWALRSHQIAHQPSPESLPEEKTRPQRALEVVPDRRSSPSVVSLHPHCQKLKIALLLQDSCAGSSLFVQMTCFP